MQTLLDRDAFCTNCGYNLRGQVKPRCPECGEAFDSNPSVGTPRRVQWFLVILPGAISFFLIPLTAFFSAGCWNRVSLPSAFYDHLVIELGRGGICWAQVIAVGLDSFLVGAVLGLVLSLGAEEETHLSGREVVLTGATVLLPLAAMAILLMLEASSWRFEVLEVFCLLVLCAVAPFTLGEGATTWLRGRRLRRWEI